MSESELSGAGRVASQSGAAGRTRGGPGQSAITKAVILARGLGTRMREAETGATAGTAPIDARQAEAADRGMKAMIPIGRPFLDYVLSGLADAGYRDICLVIGSEHDDVRTYYTRTSPPRRVRIHFAVQAEPRGTADALLAAESFAAGDELVVMNADNYYPVDVLRALRELDGPGTVLFEPEALVRGSNIPRERIRAFAIGTVTPEGFLARLIEKPDEAEVQRLGTEALVSMNCWRVPPELFDVCRRVAPSARGELELPQAIRDAVERDGMKLRVLRSTAGVLDLSRRTDIPVVAERLRGVVVDP